MQTVNVYSNGTVVPVTIPEYNPAAVAIIVAVAVIGSILAITGVIV